MDISRLVVEGFVAIEAAILVYIFVLIYRIGRP